MSFASYSEDILKRHESDVFDLLRELEQGRVSQRRQKGVLPEFEALVKQLGALLSDPAQPAAMRLLDLRQAQVNLSYDLARSKEKIEKLGATNRTLNAENKRFSGELRKARDEIRTLRTGTKNYKAATDKQLASIEAERNRLLHEVHKLKAKVENLEIMALRAQVDRVY